MRALALLLLATAAFAAPIKDDSFDPYAVLGVPTDADDDTIKRAYRKLSIKLHPDRNKEDPEAQLKFANVAKAYEILSDSAAREAHKIGAFTNQHDYQKAKQKKGSKAAKTSGLYKADGPVEVFDRAALWDAASGPRDKPILLMFYAPWCTHCQQFASEYRRVALELGESAIVAAINCEENEQLCMQEQVQAYPTLRMLTPAPDKQVETWMGGLQNAEEVIEWAQATTSSALLTVTSSTFRKQVVKSEEPWLLVYSAGAWCQACNVVKPVLRKLASAMQGRMKVGMVNCDGAQSFCKNQGVGQYFPVYRLFPAGAAAKASTAEGKGQELFMSNEDMSFMPLGVLKLVEKVLAVMAPPAASNASDGAPVIDELLEKEEQEL